MANEKKHPERNPDPITGAPGSHPVGTGAGAATGGAAGAAIGAVGGPAGAMIGGAIGAVAGGFAGKAIAEQIDPTVETAHWREHYAERDYVRAGEPYEMYEPAYRYGWEARGRYPERSWEQVEPELGSEWNAYRGKSSLGWDRAKHASRDAWHRIERAIPGDLDRDGR